MSSRKSKRLAAAKLKELEDDIGEHSGSSTAALIQLLRDQQQQQQEQQQLFMQMLEDQRRELARSREEAEQKKKEEPDRGTPRLPKQTLQRLEASDDIEHFLATFERIAVQQKWPEDIWATQLAGLLMGKAMAAFASMPSKEASSYEEIKKAVLARYDVSDETHRLRFRQDRKQAGESYKNWSDRLRDHFKRWTKAKPGVTIEELMMIDQFLQFVPEELAVWLMERKPQTLEKVAELADEYTLVRSRSSLHKVPTGGHPAEKDKSDNEKGSKDPSRNRNNARGQQCYQCGQFGHLMYNCPQNPEKTPSNHRPLGLLAKGCDKVAWNFQSQKYLRKGLVDGHLTQMLVDTGCSQTVVAARLVQPSKIEQNNQVPIVCAHGDTVFYPTAIVTLQIGRVRVDSRVAVASHPPVEVLLGTDVQDGLKQPTPSKPGLAVLTRSQRKQQSATETPPAAGVAPVSRDLDTPLPTSAPSQLENSVTPSSAAVIEDASSVSDGLEEDDCPSRVPLETNVAMEKQPSFDPLLATPNEMKRLQQEDQSLNGVRQKLSTTKEDLERPRVYFYQKE